MTLNSRPKSEKACPKVITSSTNILPNKNKKLSPGPLPPPDDSSPELLNISSAAQQAATAPLRTKVPAAPAQFCSAKTPSGLPGAPPPPFPPKGSFSLGSPGASSPAGYFRLDRGWEIYYEALQAQAQTPPSLKASIWRGRKLIIRRPVGPPDRAGPQPRAGWEPRLKGPLHSVTTSFTETESHPFREGSSVVLVCLQSCATITTI